MHFLSLNMDSTIPYPGCTEYSPCLIKADDPAPKIVAKLSMLGNPVPGAPLEFTTEDTWKTPAGDFDPANMPNGWPGLLGIPASVELPESQLYPANSVEADDAGEGSVRVSNNGTEVITPTMPLLTLVDVTSPGPTEYCDNGAIASSSPRAAFEFEAPANLCKVEMAQAAVVGVKDNEICLHVYNGNDAGSCPVEIKGLQMTVMSADGVTPEPGLVFKKIEGGTITSELSCDDGDKVILFEDDCKDPEAQLGNGEVWNFTDFDKCSKPFLYAEPQTFFNINKIQTDPDYPQGRPFKVTVIYECGGDCSTGDLESRTFNLMTPYP
jgi:hypothetical protein